MIYVNNQRYDETENVPNVDMLKYAANLCHNVIKILKIIWGTKQK